MSAYVQSRVIAKFYEYLSQGALEKKQCWMLILLANLLQLKEINQLSNLELSKEHSESLKGLLERLLIQYATSKEVVYVAEPLSLIFKQATLDSLKSMYKLYEENREGSVEDQIIPLQILLSEGSSERREMVEELERTG